MKRLTEKLKLMFVRQPRLQQPVVSSRFTITYCVDGNLGTVQSWECIAESKEMAEYDFWDSHNSLYTDILSVEENGC
jgi:hypothetical protein